MLEDKLVKVIATLGPASMDYPTVLEMMRHGVDGFRIAFSHGNTAQWERILDAILAAEKVVGRRVAIIGDLEGPRIRLGDFPGIKVRPGEKVRFSCEPGKGVPVDDPTFFRDLRVGDKVLAADGKVVLEAESVEECQSTLRVIEGTRLDARKGLVIQGREYSLPPLTEKDLDDLKFMAYRPFSHVMASYVRSPDQIRLIKEKLEEMGRPDIRVLAKIETPSGVSRIKEIARESDGIVVARGDLGMYYPLEEIPSIQEWIIDNTMPEIKPVILATELLPSLYSSPVPSRSDVVDVYNAGKTGVDAILLTGETAVGRHPVHAVRWARRILDRAAERFHGRPEPPVDHEYRLAHGLVELSESIDAKLVVYSKTGTFPHRISGFRPRRSYIAGLPTEEAVRTVSILWGIIPVYIPAEDYEEGIEATIRKLADQLEGKTLVLANWSREWNTYKITVKIDWKHGG